MTKGKALVAAAVCAASIVSIGTSAQAAPSENGCNGLLNAGFATFKNVGDTRGHQTVHHQQDAHGCHHH